jgi:hypothetical protein
VGESRADTLEVLWKTIKKKILDPASDLWWNVEPTQWKSIGTLSRNDC